MTHPVRRKILKIAAALPVSLPVFGMAAGESGSGFSYYRVKNQVTGEGVRAGAVLLVDADITDFDGDGYYLYPDWGSPVVYEVKARGGDLVFHYPGSDRSLWRLSATRSYARFSGRVEGVLDALPTGNDLQVLEVPVLPVA